MQATSQPIHAKRMCGNVLVSCGTRFQSGISGVSPISGAQETTEVITSPSISPTSTNSTSTGYQPPLPPPSSDGQSSPLPASSSASQSPPLSAPSATSAAPAPSHRSRLPTPALVGAILAAVLASAITAALVRRWVRYRRARAHALLPTQFMEPDGMATTEHTTDSAIGQPTCLFQRSHAEEVVSLAKGSSRTESLGSEPGSSRGATIFERPPSSRPPTPDPHVGRKDHDTLRDETTNPPPSPRVPVPVSPPMEDISALARREASESEAAPELVAAGAQGERLLHLALPWIFGQRVLAMMAGEDARSVDSDDSDPLPAYAPRG
ncbi:uncharacterized protein TRAVEDRAFT_51568 [Trametes versicolor FP-101664 SS1]|uniref:uncharacterized protein n=1 Tax=Trametes versicolor (strain FP-101664) TaxID=717944 RepID=UPI0004621534|nr:uncharacterized protein TRAVEDRAFT_51568 [Trametes versicolor FP-101664 SS1]EIW53828.1 hypothetical protein TRAVEDRAFT_51568 [Trametes versicolor FP-101664 SS1]